MKESLNLKVYVQASTSILGVAQERSVIVQVKFFRAIPESLGASERRVLLVEKSVYKESDRYQDLQPHAYMKIPFSRKQQGNHQSKREGKELQVELLCYCLQEIEVMRKGV